MNTDEIISFAKSGVDERQTKKQLIKLVLGTVIFIPVPLVFGIIAGDICPIFAAIMTVFFIASTAATVNILKDGLTVKKRIKANIVACAELAIQFTLFWHSLHFILIGPSKIMIYIYLPIVFLPLITILYMERQLKSGSLQSIKKHVIIAAVTAYVVIIVAAAAGRFIGRSGGGDVMLEILIFMTTIVTSIFSARIGMQIVRLYCIKKLEDEGVEID